MPTDLPKTGAKMETSAKTTRKGKKSVKPAVLRVSQGTVDVLTCNESRVEALLSEGEST